MRLSDLEKYKSVTIQCHDHPDADAIGAGYGLYRYFTDRGCSVRLIYSGQSRIQRTNLKLMIEKLDIPLEYVAPGELKRVDGLLLTVDCQYGEGNVTYIEAEHVAVIDHHPLTVTGLKDYRVQQNLGSCSTLVWSMLREEHYPVAKDVNLGTALYYGLYMDTNQFSELFNPLDMDMWENVTVNKSLMARLRNSNLSLQELEIAGIAMIRYNYNENFHFAVIRAQSCDPNILGLISDFLLQVDVIDTCVVYNEMNDGYKLSVRSCIREVSASELADYLTEGIGSGGGHYEKAGGFISRKLYRKKYPTRHTEDYFNNRMMEYFGSFEILTSRDMNLDVTKMRRYARSNEPVWYIRAEDIVRPGAQISIRTEKENFESVVAEGMYFAIERDGVVHPMTEERFHLILKSTDEKMSEEDCRDMEYVPVIKDWTYDRLYRLTDYAKLCVPKKEFRIYAMRLDRCVKLFPEWEEDKYMLGRPGDYLAVSEDDLRNVFIEPGDKFLDRFHEM